MASHACSHQEFNSQPRYVPWCRWNRKPFLEYRMVVFQLTEPSHQGEGSCFMWTSNVNQKQNPTINKNNSNNRWLGTDGK